MKKVSYSSRPKAKVSHLWHPGTSRAQPWLPVGYKQLSIKAICQLVLVYVPQMTYCIQSLSITMLPVAEGNGQKLP